MRKSSLVVCALVTLVIVVTISNTVIYFCNEKVAFEQNVGVKTTDVNYELSLAEMKNSYQLSLVAVNNTYEQRLLTFKNEYEDRLADITKNYEKRIEDINKSFEQRLRDTKKDESKYLSIKNCLETRVIKDGLYPASCVDEVFTSANNLLTPPYPTSTQPLWRKFKEAKKKYNVLFLHMWFHMTKTMDRDFIQLYDAAKRSPLINVTELWGSGWEGWKPRNETMESSGENCYKNILRRFPNVQWDAVIIEADRFHPIPELSRKLAPFNAVYHHELYCKEYGKCKLPWDIPYANIFFMSYANSLPGIFHGVTTGENKYAEKLFVHVPHGSDKNLFYRPPEEQRNTSVLLSGKVGYLYPLRQKLQKMINNGDIPKNLTHVREHPGYHNMGNPENKQWNFTNASELQTINYANNLKNTKILLVTRSVRHYAVRKYTEGAIAGCLLIGNIPPERQDEFRQYMVEINENDSNEKITETINWWATHDKERIYRAKIGQQIALQKYTYDAYVEQMISSFVAFEQGYRGVYFPHQFGTSGILG